MSDKQGPIEEDCERCGRRAQVCMVTPAETHTLISCVRCCVVFAREVIAFGLPLPRTRVLWRAPSGVNRGA